MKTAYNILLARGTFPDGSPVKPMDPPTSMQKEKPRTPARTPRTPAAGTWHQSPQRDAWGQDRFNGKESRAPADNAWPKQSLAHHNGSGWQGDAWGNQDQASPASKQSTDKSSNHDHWASNGQAGDNSHNKWDAQGGDGGWVNDANKPQGGDAGRGDTAAKVDAPANAWDNAPQAANDAIGWGATAQDTNPGATGWGDQGGNNLDNKSKQGDENHGWGDGAPAGGNNGWGDPALAGIDNNNNWGGAAPADGNNDWTNNKRSGQDNAWGDVKNDTWTATKPPEARSTRSRQSSGSVRTSAVSTKASYDPRSHIKPYWAAWRGEHNHARSAGGRPPREAPREAYTYPAGPKPVVSVNKPTDASHAVQAGRGADYTHRTYRPVYLDDMDMPYAVFTFKYRSKSRIEELLGRQIDGDTEKIETSVERGELMGFSKEQLVEQLMRSKIAPTEQPQVSSGQGHGWANGASDEPKNAWGGRGGNDAAWDSGNNRNTDRNADAWDSQTKKSSSKKLAKSKASVAGNGWDMGVKNNAVVNGGWDQIGAGQTGGTAW